MKLSFGAPPHSTNVQNNPRPQTLLCDPTHLSGLHSIQISTSAHRCYRLSIAYAVGHIAVGSLSASNGIAPQLHEPKAGVVANIHDVAQELISVLLSTAPKVFGKNPKTVMYLLRRIQTEI
ncbi:hypothetical protein ACFX2J_013442 [Malus domestica]